MLILFATITILMVGCTQRVFAQTDLPVAIKQRIAELAEPGRNRIGRTAIVSAVFLMRFYEARAYEPAWHNPINFRDLRMQILESRNDGLNIDDFHAHALGFGGLDFWPPAMTDAERDILKSSALVNLLYQLYFGKLTPEKLDPHWNLKRPRSLPIEDAVNTISLVLEKQAIGSLVAQARSRDPGYSKLRQALISYRSIVERGGWPIVPAGTILKPGMSDRRILIVRQRLAVTGDHSFKGSENSDTYDPPLVEAVEKFQRRHGIDVDGIIGPAVTRAMGITAEQKVEQIRVNLERARWISRALRQRKDVVIVNTAGFYLLTFLDGKFAWWTDVITGKPYHKTPVFKDRIRYIEFNPTWTIPSGILRRDILPKLRSNSGYLAAKGYDLVGANGAKIDPATINWQTASGRRFPYRIVQPPGPKNALGRVKFMFPNKYNVYLHDTPGRQLFSKTGRAFSAGCVRVRDPLKFAELLLGNRNGISRQRIDQIVKSGRLTRINLSKPVPVAILYWTADPLWEGGIRFYNDVYKRDAKVLQALNAKFRPSAK